MKRIYAGGFIPDRKTMVFKKLKRMKSITFLTYLYFACLCCACSQSGKSGGGDSGSSHAAKLKPAIVTGQVRFDTDDPAIWIDTTDLARSLILGTDKHEQGALYVFDLNGRIIGEKSVSGLKRPNNVDVMYGLSVSGRPIDIAVVTERSADRLRVFRVPDMEAVDNGGIPVFEGEAFRKPMGIALYKRPSDGNVYAIVGRKDGPVDGTYLWQYLLEDDGTGKVRARKVREFGHYSGNLEIEAIAVDNDLGYVYYSDEGVGIRKYYADPDSSDTELALFATEGFARDHEGICIYAKDDGTGYILVSDQQADKFHLFTREGTRENPHDHRLVKVISASTHESDGCEVTSLPLNASFPGGLFVAMSNDKTFQYYSWKDIIGE